MTIVDAQLHEQGIINFINPNKKERVAQLLANPKKREKILNDLNCNGVFSESCILSVAKSKASDRMILATLKEMGAPDQCYVMSGNEIWDQKWFHLEDILDKNAWQDFPTFISCIPGRLAYFAGELSNRFFLVAHK